MSALPRKDLPLVLCAPKPRFSSTQFRLTAPNLAQGEPSCPNSLTGSDMDRDIPRDDEDGNEDEDEDEDDVTARRAARTTMVF